MSDTPAPPPPPLSAYDAEDLGHLAHELVLAQDDKARLAREEAEAVEKLHDAHERTKGQRDALEGLLESLRQELPPAEELAARLDGLRSARAEERRLGEAEAEARVEANRLQGDLRKARARAAALVDSLDAMPLIDWALRNRREAEAAAGAGAKGRAKTRKGGAA